MKAQKRIIALIEKAAKRHQGMSASTHRYVAIVDYLEELRLRIDELEATVRHLTDDRK